MVDSMFVLSSEESAILNNVSREKDPEVFLATRVQDTLTYLRSVVRFGTPVNGAAASKVLSIDGVVIDGETVLIGDDVYEFCADDAQSVSAVGNIPVDIEIHSVKSTGTLTMDTQPLSGDKVTIGTKVYTFVPVGTDTADGEVSIGADLAEAQANLVAAINGTDGISTPHPLVSAADFAADDCVITALVGGVLGDAIATTETFTAGTNIFAVGTLGGGVDCLAADAVTALVLAITASDTQGVGAADGAGNTVVLTADDAGAAGNDIALGETMANGAFAGGATALSGGADGTVSDRVQLLVDADYLYVCIAANGVGGTSWRRIALGNVF